MAKKMIRGRIIRILDNTTVIVNLGKVDGVVDGSIFSIIAEPENIVDPVTQEVLGTVSVVKGNLRAQSVSDKFTICTSRWQDYQRIIYEPFGAIADPLGFLRKSVEEGTELRVSPKEVKPWRAQSEDIVRIGDQIETLVSQQDESLQEHETIPEVTPTSTEVSSGNDND